MMNKSFSAKFKWRAENITAGETWQQNLNDRAEGLRTGTTSTVPTTVNKTNFPSQIRLMFHFQNY
jgi:hypothetical protein